MPKQIAPEQLAAHRAETFRLRPALALRDVNEAVRFVNERGFVHFWPIKDVTLPSLWSAVAGDRPVASEHDDPGHVTWGWKDDMLDKRRWYYAKVLRGKATMISLDVVPAFYALSENFGDPESDYLQLYDDGLLSQAGKAIFEALLHEGPLDTVNLRRTIHMTSQASNSPFERGLNGLQRDFKILPVGVAQTGAWRYSFVYDLVHRFYPELPARARSIARSAARETLAALYFDAVGAASVRDVKLLFQWTAREVQITLQALTEAGRLCSGYRVAAAAESYFVLPALA